MFRNRTGLVRFRFLKGTFFLVVHSLLLNRTSSLLVHFKSNFLFFSTCLVRFRFAFNLNQEFVPRPFIERPLSNHMFERAKGAKEESFDDIELVFY